MISLNPVATIQIAMLLGVALAFVPFRLFRAVKYLWAIGVVLMMGAWFAWEILAWRSGWNIRVDWIVLYPILALAFFRYWRVFDRLRR